MILLDALLVGARRPDELVGTVGNTQAITAVHKGYSKKLKFPERAHRCAIGFVHEPIGSGQLCVDYSHALIHRGDGFIKCFSPPSKFIEARTIMFMVLTGPVVV